MKCICALAIVVFAQPLNTLGQKRDPLFRIQLGLGVGYGIVTGARERTCSQQVPGRNTSLLLCGSEKVNVIFPHFRFGVRISPSSNIGLFGVAGIEGLDRRSKHVFHSTDPDTLDYSRYLIKYPQLNAFVGIGKELGRVHVVVGGSAVFFESAQYFRWTPDGTKERWQDSQRVQSEFKFRPQVMLLYNPILNLENWRAFLVVDSREKLSMDRNVLDFRLGVLYTF